MSALSQVMHRMGNSSTDPTLDAGQLRMVLAAEALLAIPEVHAELHAQDTARFGAAAPRVSP